ncbi:MAG: S8 family serine peptidase, partial [Saprospiraceae bacterium]|nr:S8 family serine peptidase [Saprospiraceae bacterium]
MKNIISNSLQKVLLIIFVLAINLTNLFAQANPKLQAIVMFEKNIITLPHGNTEADVNELKIKSFEVKNIFSKYNARFIRKAFPLFSPNDTLVIASTGEQVKLADLSNIYLFDFSDTNSVSEFINDIKGLTEVIYAEPNYHDFRTQGFPNDPHYENGDLWGLNNYGQNGGTTDADIDAPEAWQITTGSNVLIGVIDDGVDSGHEELIGKVSGDAGVYSGNSNWSFGHGTHVSGIAAAIGNNSKGIAGVNWAASINSQRIENGSDIDFYNGIMSAINAGSMILNNSWGGYSYSTTVRMAFANAYKLNIVSIAAMGNDNTSSILYPAGYGQGIISIGATDRSDNRSIWIRPDGTIKGSNYGNHIDVSAPGTSIWSSLPYTNQYDSWNGTSMAAPFVSGIASLLKGYNPNLYNDDIEQIIRISTDDKGPVGWDQEYGTGRVNAYNALRLLQAPYQLSQLSVSSGSIHSGTNNYALTIYGASGLQD